MKTLTDVVKLIVSSINMPNFSAFDITGLVRHHVESNKTTEKFDIKLSPPNSPHWYDVRHNDVKQIIGDMLDDGDLTRVSNGSYYLYNKVPAPAILKSVQPVIVMKPRSVGMTTATIAPIQVKSKPSSLEDMTFNYLSNQPTKFATVKKVQSALKRKGNFTCSEIITAVLPHSGIDVSIDLTAESKSLLQLKKR